MQRNGSPHSKPSCICKAHWAVHWKLEKYTKIIFWTTTIYGDRGDFKDTWCRLLWINIFKYQPICLLCLARLESLNSICVKAKRPNQIRLYCVHSIVNQSRYQWTQSNYFQTSVHCTVVEALLDKDISKLAHNDNDIMSSYFSNSYNCVHKGFH